MGGGHVFNASTRNTRKSENEAKAVDLGLAIATMTAAAMMVVRLLVV